MYSVVTGKKIDGLDIAEGSQICMKGLVPLIMSILLGIVFL